MAVNFPFRAYIPPSGGSTVWINCTNQANVTSLAHWNNVGIDITSNPSSYVSVPFVDITGATTTWYWQITGVDHRLDTDTMSPPVPQDPVFPDDIARSNWTTSPGVNANYSISGLNPAKTYTFTCYVYDGTGNGNGTVTWNTNTQSVNADTPHTLTFSSLSPDGSGNITGIILGVSGDFGTLNAFIIQEN